MNEIVRWAPDDRAALFQETATRMGPAPAIIEKDFWVCWVLSRLFAQPARQPAMLFKGGTSLSKVYGFIARFSEDIDLSLDRADLGFTGERDPEKAVSRKATRLLVEDLGRACTEYLTAKFLPETVKEFETHLGPVGTTWSLEPDSEDPQTILFTYPGGLAPAIGGYVRPVVRLEFGARSDHWPAIRRRDPPVCGGILPRALRQ